MAINLLLETLYYFFVYVCIQEDFSLGCSEMQYQQVGLLGVEENPLVTFISEFLSPHCYGDHFHSFSNCYCYLCYCDHSEKKSKRYVHSMHYNVTKTHN